MRTNLIPNIIGSPSNQNDTFTYKNRTTRLKDQATLNFNKQKTILKLGLNICDFEWLIMIAYKKKK